MTYSTDIIEKAAALHDIGKVLLRAQPGKETHSARGVAFLTPWIQDSSAGKAILRAVGHHHYKDLKGASLPNNDLSYIIYEADNIAAGTDRRANEDGSPGFRATMALENVFNSFGDAKGTQTAFYLRGLLEEKRMLYPTGKEGIQDSASEYKKIVQTLEQNFQQKSPVDMAVPELMQILAGTMSYVPSSTATNEVADISLYDHQKITAAYGACMYLYFQDKGITDFQSVCAGKDQATMRQQPIYLLVSGDISGIQDFIYTIPSKGALKSLRGRSFYLDFVLEHLADEVLSAVGVSRNCLLYTGGGHFYMLLPNIPAVTGLLTQFAKHVNDWFMQTLGNRLYLGLGWTPCTANELMGVTGHGASKAFQRVSQIVAQHKLQRYDTEQLTRLFSPESDVNAVPEGTRECAVCHQSVPEQDLQVYEEGEENACPFCRSLLLLGKRILDGEVIVISPERRDGALPLPGWQQSFYAYTAKKETLDSFALPITRVYIKNEMYTGSVLATQVWVGDYTSRNEGGDVLDFSELAEYSGGTIDATGIKRLGVMRADVDNLGAAFTSGFSASYDTLSRKAALSRQLSLFFKRYINDICAGFVNGVNEEEKKKFSLFGTAKEQKRLVHIIYSGGDDMFLVGAWDDLIELAVDIRRNFAQFTNGKLTFSAGIGFFNPSCPIAEMARATGELEDIAKNHEYGNGKKKDSIMLFGDETTPQVYSWNQFTDDVCGEKLAFWKNHFQNMTGTDNRKLHIGKSGLYRLLSLVKAGEGKGRINLARFAYVLARMEPQGASRTPERLACYGEVRHQLYQWYRQEGDRKALRTALELVIYQLRE